MRRQAAGVGASHLAISGVEYVVVGRKTSSGTEESLV